MSRIESGAANPMLTMLHALALDVHVKDLFEDAAEAPRRGRAGQPLSRQPGGYSL